MALPGELLGTGTITCDLCGAELPLKVCQSGAGYYLGHFCNQCGPYSRESGYFRTREEAKRALQSENEDEMNLRDTEFHPGEFIVEEF